MGDLEEMGVTVDGARALADTDRGGVVGGHSPIHSSIQLYLIQIILIVTLCFVLGHVVKKWNQPRVIAEVCVPSMCNWLLREAWWLHFLCLAKIATPPFERGRFQWRYAKLDSECVRYTASYDSARLLGSALS